MVVPLVNDLSTTTIQQALCQAKLRLSTRVADPGLEAEILLAYVLSKPRSYLHAWPEKQLTYAQVTQWMSLIEQRSLGVPVAYIIGEREFWSIKVSVNCSTLIPRPETELLVETVLEIFPQRDSIIKLADLGTGSGAIALALAYERPNWQIFATDISAEALQLAHDNACALRLKNISFYHGDWCDALPGGDFDVIVSNPPYLAEAEWETYQNSLKFEPKIALVSGEDGLHAVRKLSRSATAHLQSGGYLLTEHGFTQGREVRTFLAEMGYKQIISRRDLAGLERVTLASV